MGRENIRTRNKGSKNQVVAVVVGLEAVSGFAAEAVSQAWLFRRIFSPNLRARLIQSSCSSVAEPPKSRPDGCFFNGACTVAVVTTSFLAASGSFSSSLASSSCSCSVTDTPIKRFCGLTTLRLFFDLRVEIVLESIPPTALEIDGFPEMCRI